MITPTAKKESRKTKGNQGRYSQDVLIVGDSERGSEDVEGDKRSSEDHLLMVTDDERKGGLTIDGCLMGVGADAHRQQYLVE